MDDNIKRHPLRHAYILKIFHLDVNLREMDIELEAGQILSKNFVHRTQLETLFRTNLSFILVFLVFSHES